MGFGHAWVACCCWGRIFCGGGVVQMVPWLDRSWACIAVDVDNGDVACSKETGNFQWQRELLWRRVRQSPRMSSIYIELRII